jgi:hypothetical protein
MSGMRQRGVLGVALAIVTLAVPIIACSTGGGTLPPALQNPGTGSPVTGGGGGGSSSGTGYDAGVSYDAAVSCGAPTLNATGQCQTYRAGAAPAPLGGTILDGTYLLTEVNLYDGADAAAASTTCDIRYEIVVSAGTILLTYELYNSDLVQNASGTFSTNGNVLTEDFTCQAFNGGSVTPTTAYAGYTYAGDLKLYGLPFSMSPTMLSLTTEYVFSPQ